jgi:hypothetical protein
MGISITGFRGQSNLANFTIRVSNPNTAPVWTTPTGSVGTATERGGFSFQLAASDDRTIASFAVIGGTLPAGISLSGSGLLSGTAPDVEPAGQTFTFTVRATDDQGMFADRQFAITVENNPAFDTTMLLLHMDGAADSTTVTDSTGRHATVTAVGDARISTAQAKFGQSLALDGTGDYLQIPDSPDWDLGTASFTLESWVYLNAQPTSTPGGYMPIIAQGGGAVGSNPTLHLGWSIHLSSTISLMRWAGSDQTVSSGSLTWTTGQWYHIAVQRIGNTVTFYRDGQVVGVAGTTVTYNRSQTTGLWIGHGRTGTGGVWYNYLNGYLDDLRVAKRAVYASADLTPTEAPAAASGDVVVMNFESSNPWIEDTGRTVTTVGTTGRSTGVPKFGVSTLYLAGTNGSHGLTLADSADWDFGTQDFSIEAWIRLSGSPGSATGTQMGVIMHGDGMVDSNGVYCTTSWGLYLTNTGMTLGRWSRSGDQNIASGSLTWATGQWYHIAVARTAGGVRFFRNGRIVSHHPTTNSYNRIENKPVYIGHFRTGGGGVWYNNFNGYLDGLRVSKGVARYSVDFTPPTLPVTAL